MGLSNPNPMLEVNKPRISPQAVEQCFVAQIEQEITALLVRILSSHFRAAFIIGLI
jgi:hypothetical protein